MRAKKRFGQNFLQDAVVIAKIVEALELEPGDKVAEIGPGEGALTELILAHDVDLTAVEIDRDLAALLRRRYDSVPNFRLIEADVLSLDLAELQGSSASPIKLIGNLPYNISTPILERLMSAAVRIERMVLMLQREVVERVTAAPGNSDRGYFTVLIENAFEVERLLEVSPQAFRPAPAVHSSVVKMVPKTKLINDNAAFRSLLSNAFAQKRKTILNNLRRPFAAAEEGLQSADIDPRRRAETLTLKEWKLLGEALEIIPVR